MEVRKWSLILQRGEENCGDSQGSLGRRSELLALPGCERSGVGGLGQLPHGFGFLTWAFVFGVK